MLGADEFGFATAPLVVEGCMMMRQCHLNTCPVGIATQDPELRKRFRGKPGAVINYFFFVAEEARRIMAELGIRRFEDLIGRSDLLVQRDDIDNWKAKGVDLSRILHRPSAEPCAIRHTLAQDHQLEKNLDHALLPRFACAIEGGETVSITTAVKNTHRSVGAMISHEIVKRHERTR